MNDVDISNQLRNQYRIDHWMQKYKCWWTLLFFCYGVMFVNSYVLYKSLLIFRGRKLSSHYELRYQVVLEILNPENYDRRDKVVEKRVMKRKARKISKLFEK